MVANPPVADPARVASPVLPVSGGHDGVAATEGPWDFFARPQNGGRRFAVPASAARSLGFGLNRARYRHAAHASTVDAAGRGRLIRRG